MIFFDVEASSLVDGYPIEIGWAWVRDGEARSEGHLIRPTPLWLESKRWDPAAERLHGISLERLQAEGKTCHEVVALINEGLAGQVLISGNPEYDGRWLGQVFETAGAVPTFKISDISADALIAAATDKFGILDLEYTFAERETAPGAPDASGGRRCEILGDVLQPAAARAGGAGAAMGGFGQRDRVEPHSLEGLSYTRFGRIWSKCVPTLARLQNRDRVQD